MIEQRVTLRYGAQQVPAIVQAVQGDTGRDVIFELADYEIPAGATANYYIDKPDGNAVYNSAEVISSTEILAHLTEQALAVPGRNNGQVRILSDGEVITSFDFVLEVEAFRGILHMQSETEVNIFDAAIQEAVDDAIEEIQAQTPVVTGMQNSIAPTYSSSSTYAVGDYVMYNAQLYRCTTAITTAEAWTATHWAHVPLAKDVSGLKSAFDKFAKAVTTYEVKESKYLAPSETTVTITSMSGYFINLYKVENDGWFNISGVFSGSVDAVVIFTDDSLATYNEVIYISTLGAIVAKNYTMFIRQGSIIGLCSSNEHSSKMAVYSIDSTIISTEDIYQTVIKTDLAIPAYFGYKGYVSNDGAIVKSASFLSRYKYFIYPIEEGDICEVSTHIQGSVSYACFANSSLQQIGEKLVCTQNVQVEAYSGVITAPQNAKYLITTEYYENKTQVIVKSRITKLEEKTERISENNAIIPVTPTIQAGKYIDRNGDVQSMSSYSIYSYVMTDDNYVNVSGVTKGFVTVVSIWRDNVLVNKVLVSNDNTNDTPFDETLYLKESDEVRVTQLVSLGVPSFKVMNEIISTVIHENDGQQEIYGKVIAPVISGASKTDDFDIAGKTINIVGDSMTAMGNSYIANYVASKLNCTVRGYGYAGSAITYSATEQYPSFVERIVDEGGTYNYQNADVWVIWGGYNDYNSDVEIGDLNSTSDSTLYGALKTIIYTLQSKLNMPSIIFVTPCRVNRESKKMYEIVTAMTAISRNYGVPILNLYNESGLSANNFRTLTDDGLHLNELGRNMVYPKIAKFIKNHV